MKRLSLITAATLLASTPLFAMDGGGVSISGEANFGVKFKENDGGANAPNELQFHHEFDIKFSASGTTDGGIGFGGSMSIDNTESVTGASKAGTAAKPLDRIQVAPIGTLTAAANDETIAAGVTAIYANAATPGVISVTVENGTITGYRLTEASNPFSGGEGVFKISGLAANEAIILIDGTPTKVEIDEDSNWVLAANNGAVDGTATNNIFLYKVGPGAGPMMAATAATFDPDAKQKVENHGEVYISMDMHKLTIGSDLDAADKLAGGLTDPGFDGIGIDDEAERVWGGSAADVRYDGDFGVASVAISYGDNKGDAEWAAGFSFNVDPVTFGAGFDSNNVMSIGMGFTQGQISMNALFSTDSDHDETDAPALKPTDAAENKDATYISRAVKPDLKNQAMGVDMTYQMSDTTSLVLVAAQHKKESASAYYTKDGDDISAEGTRPTTATERAGLKQHWVKSSTTIDAFGVGFSHDLGGGATLKAGAGSVDSNATADLGITMKF